jgi:hypothetical protein
MVLGLLVAWLAVSATSWAAVIVSDRDDRDRPEQKQNFILPFFLTTETLDLGLGASYNRGMFDSETNMFFAGYGTFNRSWGLIAEISQFRLAGSRWFVDPFAILARNTQQRFYGDLASPAGV